MSRRIRGHAQAVRPGRRGHGGLGTRCLVARRLLERGVRFVQVWSGADNGFPAPQLGQPREPRQGPRRTGRGLDKPVGGADQGPESARPAGRHDRLLDDGVRPHAVQPGKQGPRPQSVRASPPGWRAAAFKGGVTYGASDEWSYKAVENPIYCYDVHATVLHLLGIDHTRLTFRHNGIDRRLTDVHGHMISDVLA